MKGTRNCSTWASRRGCTARLSCAASQCCSPATEPRTKAAAGRPTPDAATVRLHKMTAAAEQMKGACVQEKRAVLIRLLAIQRSPLLRTTTRREGGEGAHG